jgi:hypothetical protein
VSRKLVGQMGDCIRTKLEAENAGGGQAEVAAQAPAVNGGAPMAETGAPSAPATPRRARASRSAGAGAAAEVEQTAPAASEAAPVAEPAPAPAAVPRAPQVQISAEPAEAAAPLDALALARSVAADRLKAVGPGRLAGIAVALFAVFALGRLLRRRGKR